MCMTIPQRKFTTIKEVKESIQTATKNIVVFKTTPYSAKSNFRSSVCDTFRYTRYEKHTLSTKLEDSIIANGYWEQYDVEVGFHSFKSMISAIFHGTDEYYTHVFIIPKGSRYLTGYYNNDNIINYVSEDLVWIGNAYNPLNWIRAKTWK